MASEPRAAGFPVGSDELAAFCRKWLIRRVEFGGAAKSYDAGEQRSDAAVEVLVWFEEGDHWSTFDLVRMEHELSEMAGTEVHVVDAAAIRAKDRAPAHQFEGAANAL